MEALLLILVGLGLATFICLGSGCCVGVVCTSVLFPVVFWWALELIQLCEVVQSLERERNRAWLVADKR